MFSKHYLISNNFSYILFELPLLDDSLKILPITIEHD